MFKPKAAILEAAFLGAALVGTAVTLVPALSREAPAATLKGDRLDIRPSPDGCSAAWPYYGAHCLRDPRRADAPVRQVRLVAVDAIRH